MAEVNNCPEPTLPTKRFPDLSTEDSLRDPKKQKLENPDDNGKDAPEPLSEIVVQEEKDKEEQVEEKENKPAKKGDDDDEGEVEDEERPNGKAEIDRKGKGILIEEDEEEDDEDDVDDDDDDDDSDDDSDSDDSVGGEFSDDDDFVDDPLAEVNLDNILPSRTRRKNIHPGAYLATDLPDEDSGESDDPDA